MSPIKIVLPLLHLVSLCLQLLQICSNRNAAIEVLNEWKMSTEQSDRPFENLRIPSSKVDSSSPGGRNTISITKRDQPATEKERCAGDAAFPANSIDPIAATGGDRRLDVFSLGAEAGRSIGAS